MLDEKQNLFRRALDERDVAILLVRQMMETLAEACLPSLIEAANSRPVPEGLLLLSGMIKHHGQSENSKALRRVSAIAEHHELTWLEVYGMDRSGGDA